MTPAPGFNMHRRGCIRTTTGPACPDGSFGCLSPRRFIHASNGFGRMVIGIGKGDAKYHHAQDFIFRVHFSRYGRLYMLELSLVGYTAVKPQLIRAFGTEYSMGPTS